MRQIRKLSPELAKKAAEELNEDEAALQDGIKELREWLSSMPYIKEPLDDQWLAAFIRGTKFSIERAKKKLENFYTVRTVIPEFFKNRDPTVSPLKDLIKNGCFLPLENKTDPTGPHLMYCHLNYDTSKFSLSDFVKYCIILVDIKVDEDDGFVISGGCSICDMKHVTFKHLRSCTPAFIRKCVKTFSDAYPLRTKGVHFVNTPLGFRTVFRLARMFVPAKIKDRLQIHSSIESIYRYIPQENLPEEFGGQAGTLDSLTKKWIAKIESRKKFLVDGEQYCTDESLRSA